MFFKLLWNSFKKIHKISGKEYYYKKYKEQIFAKNEAAIKWSKKNDYDKFIIMIDNIYLP